MEGADMIDEYGFTCTFDGFAGASISISEDSFKLSIFGAWSLLDVDWASFDDRAFKGDTGAVAFDAGGGGGGLMESELAETSFAARLKRISTLFSKTRTLSASTAN